MNVIRVPEVLLPGEDVDLSVWPVVACDQFTSQPEYWQEVSEKVGDKPSTYNLILPEVYLGAEDENDRIENIHKTMDEYLEKGILKKTEPGFILVKRKISETEARLGLVVNVDLEAYEYKRGQASLIRPTEMTVEERIPPRLRVRKGAKLELPHIMLLIDNPEKDIIEPLFDRLSEFTKVYDTPLMQDGGSLEGWLIKEGELTDKIMQDIENLTDRDSFNKKYGLTKEYPMLNLAVGDGNHSMATAKANWEEIKKDLSLKEAENHPARFCLCEIVNIHDESLIIEPIHRVMFGVDAHEIEREAKEFYEENGCTLEVEDGKAGAFQKENCHSFMMCSTDGWKTFSVKNPKWGIAVATIQSFMDDYLMRHSGASIDYIHGADIVERLGTSPDNAGFILPDIEKGNIFAGVIKDGVLPRKTFSMGEANEKRYYMESRVIL